MKSLKKWILNFYYFAWIINFNFSRFLWFFLIPLNCFIAVKIFKKSKEDCIRWKKRYYKAELDFPGGIIDWFTFALVIGVFAIFLFLFSIYVYTIPSKVYLIIEILFGIFIWIITEKNKTWMQKKIKSYLAKKGYGQYL